MSRCFVVLVALFHGWLAFGQVSHEREPLGPSSRKTGLVISEILYNPRVITTTNETLQFIELHNSNPWPENIGGYTIDGSIEFEFPPDTILPAGGFLVVAFQPAIVADHYGITNNNLFGPYSARLPTTQGTVQLLNRDGALLLSVGYSDTVPWPIAPDGKGHSLVLARPSFGEDDVRAWAQSDRIDGSPGIADPVTSDPLDSVVFNEWLAHTDPPLTDAFELYNHGNTPVDLSGAYVADALETNRFRIPNGTILPARGFLWWAADNSFPFQLLSEGERIYLVNSNQTRVIDAIDFRGQSNAVASGRSPDGGPYHYCLATRTLGGPNSNPLRFGVVINEIMYNPMSGELDDEYVEIHNRLNAPANISVWEFVNGIGYLFPSNTIMPAKAYWVIARNPTNLMALYPNLNTNNTFGPYTGTLANGGERLTLTSADYGNFQIGGSNITLRLAVTASEVFYGDGGRWGNWSDGAGSSLELIDPEADTHLPSNWADSDTSSESRWTAIEYNGPLGESLGTQANDALIVMLQGIGECLLDEVEVRVDNGPNLVANGGFENGLASWSLQGSHDFSTITSNGFAGSKCLHVRAGSRGDNQSNRILSAPFGSVIPSSAGKISIRAKVRWLRGHAEILVRLHGSGTEAYGTLALPRRLGTPAAANSRVANAGPAIYEAQHAPPLPDPMQNVVVTARAADPNGVASFTLRYRVDPNPAYTSMAMIDNGTLGDAIANDRLYSATIPGQAAGAMVAFYLEARDNSNATNTFPQDVFPPAGLTRCWPNDAVARECLVRFGETQMPGTFATYHLWVTAANSNRWHHRDTMNNTPLDGTFVYNHTRVVYNALPLFSGSPWHRPQMTNGPAGANRVDYEMNFPEDDSLLGATDFLLNNPGNPNLTTVSDLSAVAEHTVFKIFEDMHLPHNRRRYIHWFVNGSQRSTTAQREGNFIFEDVQQPSSDMVEQFFPGQGGQLFKVDDWFEFEANGFDIHANNDADLTRRTVMLDGQPALTPGPYRFMFRKRAIGATSANDYSQIFALIDAASPPESPEHPTIDPEVFGDVADWEQWMRVLAIQRAVGNWDSYGWDRGKNDYLFRPGGGLFQHMPWDIDYSLGLGRPANEPLFASNDPRVRAMFNTPAIVRAYWRSFNELVNGPFSNANLDPFIDTRVGTLLDNAVDVDLEAVDAIKTYISERRAYIQSQLTTVDTIFAVDGPASFSIASNLVVLTGTAPVGVKSITVNGEIYPVTWTSVTNFMLRLIVYPGANQFAIEGLDRFGVAIPGLGVAMDITYTGPEAEPVGAITITELMHSPAAPNAQFIEIVNQSQMNFDLSFWRVDAVNYVFPVGSIITGGQTIVLAQNKAVFLQSYGNGPVFDLFPGQLSAAGEAVALIQFTPLGERVIDGVRYEAGAPWAASVPGASIQQIDAARDNSRVSNWAYGLPTPGSANSVAAALPAFDAVWLNEVQTETLTAPMDTAGDRDPWIELFNSGTTPINLAGYFLANNYSSNLTQWPFPAGATIAPGEYKLVWADGEPGESTASEWHTSFRLDYGGTLALVRLVVGEPQITDYLTWSDPGANVSYGDFPDAQPVFRSRLFHATAGSTNLARPLPLFINEWLARNASGIRDPADNVLEDWFEIYNGGTQPINLGNFYLTDEADEPTKYRVPNNGQYIIQPRGYMLVWADDTPTQNSPTRDLHVRFRLGGNSGEIALYAPDGDTLIDLVSYLSQTNDITEGRYADGASTIYYTARPTPAEPNTVLGANTPPAFPFIPTQFAVPGQRFLLNIRASDPEYPGQQSLNYSIDSGPPGVEINSSGFFRWIISTNQLPGDFPVTVRVTDTGVPPRSGTATFIMSIRSTVTITTVAPPPVMHTMVAPNGQATFTIVTTPSHLYRVLYTDDLSSTAPWTPLDRDFVASNVYASITDNITGPQRFYRVLLVE